MIGEYQLTDQFAGSILIYICPQSQTKFRPVLVFELPFQESLITDQLIVKKMLFLVDEHR